MTYPSDLFNDPVEDDTVYDIASCTKVISTTSATMKLYDAGLIHLDDKITKWLPQAGNNGKENITIKHLLLHNAGLPPDYPFAPEPPASNHVTK